MYNLLTQLNIDFTYQYQPYWIKPYRYDFYFELNNKKYIIETDGNLGHGNYNKLSGMSAEESLEIDTCKDKKAKENGIEVIRVDCRKSELDYIKQNIISKLNNLFDSSKIHWLKCHEYACINLIKKVSEMWNNGYKNKAISEELNLSQPTIRTYLKKGAELDWCDYSVDYHKRKVICINTNAKFNSIGEAARGYGILHSCINDCCKGIQKSAGRHCKTDEPLIWMYLEDYTIEKAQERMKNVVIKNKAIKIIHLDLFENFIKKYKSANEASKETNITLHEIMKILNDKYNNKLIYESDGYQFIKSKPINTESEKEFIHNYELEHEIITEQTAVSEINISNANCI